MTKFFVRCATIAGAAMLVLALAGCDASTDSASEDSGFVGTYATKDTQGNPMTIMLGKEGTASGDRGGEKLDGSWKDDGSAVTVTWSDEWMTKITKDGDDYTKTAYKNGTQDGDPVPASKTK